MCNSAVRATIKVNKKRTQILGTRSSITTTSKQRKDAFGSPDAAAELPVTVWDCGWDSRFQMPAAEKCKTLEGQRT